MRESVLDENVLCLFREPECGEGHCRGTFTPAGAARRGLGGTAFVVGWVGIDAGLQFQLEGPSLAMEAAGHRPFPEPVSW